MFAHSVAAAAARDAHVLPAPLLPTFIVVRRTANKSLEVLRRAYELTYCTTFMCHVLSLTLVSYALSVSQTLYGTRGGVVYGLHVFFSFFFYLPPPFGARGSMYSDEEKKR